MSSSDTEVYSLEVLDRFGDAGLTGVVIMRYMGRACPRGKLLHELPGHRPRGRVLDLGTPYAAGSCARVRRDASTIQPHRKEFSCRTIFDELGMQRHVDSAKEVVSGAGVVTYKLALPSNLMKTQWIDVIYA